VAPYTLLDDFLPQAVFLRLQDYLRGYRWFSVTDIGKRGPRGTSEELLKLPGLKQFGGEFVVMKASPDLKTDKIPYPSGTPLDSVLEAVKGHMGDWKLLGCGPRLYPAGKGMPPHDDARFKATFVLYCHERWEAAWDGRLVFASGETVEPRPNRLVLVQAGATHHVNPGLQPRLSVIGYSFEPKAPAGGQVAR
jgi:hypothetical protein